MTRLRALVSIVAAPVLLGFAADELLFRPKADHELKKELRIDVEIKPEKVDFTVNGESMPPENLGVSSDVAAKVKLVVAATDKYVQSKEGRPTDLLRTFDDLDLSFEAGEDQEDAPDFDELEGKTVRFQWNGDSESYDKSFVESEGDEALLGRIIEDMDVRVLLPGKKVVEGETWEVLGDRLLPLFLPGGLPGEIGSESDREEMQTALDELRSALGKFQEDFKIACKYKGARDEGGVRVGEIDFTLRNTGKADLSRMIQTISAMEESDIHPEVDAQADIDLDGSGILLWDVAAGRIHSLSMHAEASLDLDIKANFDVEGENFDLSVKARFACNADWALRSP